jgi:rubrerythrin
MPDDARKKVAAGLLRAMQSEHHGENFYRMAASNTSDPQGQEVFEQLAREEQQHFQVLRRQYRAVLETGRPEEGLSLGERLSLAGPSPIFSDQIRSRLKDAHYEMTALSVGIQLELNAQQYYTAQAAESEDPVIEQLYRDLADWESGHYHALLAQQEALTEDYWTAAGFAPF